jgi:hypothetical protein
MPPPLGDFDGHVAPPQPGGGVEGGPTSGDAAGGTTFVASASNPKGIALVGGAVYFTSYATGASDGSVSVVSTTGGAVTPLASGQNGPWALVVVNGTVFFTLSPMAGPGGVSAVPTMGGTVTPIDTTAIGAVGIVTDGTSLFWTASSSGVLINSVSLSGGTPKQLMDFGGNLQPQGLALAGVDLYVPTTGPQAAVLHGQTSAGNLEPLDTQTMQQFDDVAVSTTAAYATLDDISPSGQILAYPRGTGSPQTIATGLDHPARLALDGTNLYFTDPTGGNVWVKDLTTQNAPTVFVSGLSAPLPIAVADALYVGVSDSILRIEKM